MFRNTTPFTREVNLKFMKYILSKLNIVILITAAICEVCYVVYAWINQEWVEALIFTVIFAGFIALYMFIFLPLIFKMSLKKVQKNPLADQHNINIFSFNEDEVVVLTTRLEKEISKVTVEYKNIHSLVINKGTMFIFITNQQAYIIEQDKMTEGTFEDLVEFMKTRQIKKFIPKLKKTKI